MLSSEVKVVDYFLVASPEIILTGVILALLGALLGFWLASSLQSRRARDALASAQHAHERQIVDLRARSEENEQQLHRIHREALERQQEQYAQEAGVLRDTSRQRLADKEAEHQAEKLHLQSQHADAIEALKSEHERNLQFFSAEQVRSIQTLKDEYQANLHSLRVDHAATLEANKRDQMEFRERLEEEHRARLQEVRTARAEEIVGLQARLDTLVVEQKELQEQNSRLEQTIRELNDSIREARRNNTFSIAKSGERLIRVIRSVQDLARELEETSLAVSGGEYSFLAAIKDEHDRDAVLKLTGDRHGDGDRDAPDSSDVSIVGEVPAAATADPNGAAEDEAETQTTGDASGAAVPHEAYDAATESSRKLSD